VAASVAETVRTQRLAIVATLARVLGDLDLAEDCLQDAVERALSRWPVDGIPQNPAAWLTVAARNRALDLLRRRKTEREKLPELISMTEFVELPPDGTSSPYDDDRLKLLFACCHPALPLPARVALTLKTVTGLSTREVARAFLVSEATMGQRLLRAKTKIVNAGIALRVPPTDQLAGRIDGVLTVVYLLFNEGYSATAGEHLREELAREAIQLGSLLTQLLPGHDEALSLLALMRLQHSRRHARISTAGELVPLDEQDRDLWDHAEIEQGLRLLAGVVDGAAGPYRLQAAIAALHATAPTPQATDWARIVRAYDALLARQPSPVVALNRLIALGFRDGPQAALDQLPELVEALQGYPPVAAVRADLLRRAGRPVDAAEAYREAIALAGTDAERHFLRRRLREVTA
jgi:RNA polymerase sigma-70 factor (ECF subfamily)